MELFLSKEGQRAQQQAATAQDYQRKRNHEFVDLPGHRTTILRGLKDPFQII